MKALVLEDDPERIKAFKQRFLGCGWAYQITTTARECIAAMASGQYGAIFLDHDLGGDTYTDPLGSNTGTAVARWMAGNQGPHRLAAVFIHSFNAPAAESMMRILSDRAVLAPGVWLPDVWRETVDDWDDAA